MIDKFDYQSALEDCKAVRDSIKSDEDFQNADSGLVLYYLNTIVSALEIAVNAQPVKRGKWECQENMPFESCNVCGYRNYDPVYTPNFCPNCGAKMDGDAGRR